MNLYEIDAEILATIDEETGEVIDLEKLEALQMAKDKKVENIALWVKDLKAEAAAIAEEVKELQHRKKVAENKAESLKQYLSTAIYGQKWHSARYAISWRKSKSVEIQDEYQLVTWAMGPDGNDDLLRFKDPELNKVAIKAAIEAGQKIPFAELVEKQNIQIK